MLLTLQEREGLSPVPDSHPSTLVLGLRNPILADDGVSIHVARAVRAWIAEPMGGAPLQNIAFAEVSMPHALLAMNPEEIIRDVNASGLRGRGGAIFVTGRRWESTRHARAGSWGNGNDHGAQHRVAESRGFGGAD
jgi:hypothetical protein